MPNEAESDKKTTPFRIIADTLQRLHWAMQGVRVFALVGKSGTGKSYKAKLVAQKFDIAIIVDDGLIVENDCVLSGRSAKKELNYLQAVRVALFDDPTHRQEAISALESTNFSKILLLGTSDKMVMRIAEHLSLPEISRFIRIEEVSSPQEIATALKSRAAGNHVIPVPASQIEQDYAHILYDRIKIFLIKRGFLKKKSHDVIEKAIVRPVFQQRAEISTEQKITKALYLLNECTKEFDLRLKISKIKVQVAPDGQLNIQCRLDNLPASASETIHAFRKFIISELQERANLTCKELHVSFKLKTPIKKAKRGL
ncbi:MAG: hypothetical protein ACRCVN_01955 [Spirochaetia bacterium]